MIVVFGNSHSQGTSNVDAIVIVIGLAMGASMVMSHQWHFFAGVSQHYWQDLGKPNPQIRTL